MKKRLLAILLIGIMCICSSFSVGAEEAVSLSDEPDTYIEVSNESEETVELVETEVESEAETSETEAEAESETEVETQPETESESVSEPESETVDTEGPETAETEVETQTDESEEEENLDDVDREDADLLASNHTHPVCGTSCSHSSHSNYYWTAWDGKSKVSGYNLHLYLTDDVVVSGSQSFNGYVDI